MIGNLLLIGQQAAAPAAPAGGMSSSIVFFGWIAIFGVMIFFMFRNQRKQQQQRQNMLESLKVGARVVTGGGIFGKITKVKDKSFMVEIADKIEIEITKAGVSSVLDQEQETK